MIESMSRAVPHPIPYQGSKRRLAPQILDYFPVEFARLVEPFAGSAAITLATAQHQLAQQFLLCDAHKPVVDLWRSIIERPSDLADEYQQLWNEQLGNEREFYNHIRTLFNKDHLPHHFLYLLARCVKAAIRYNPKGEFNNSPDNRRRGAKPEAMRARIFGASNLLSGKVQLRCEDYAEILSAVNDGDLIYMDPPYQGVCAGRDNRYQPKIEHESFMNEIEKLLEIDAMFVISYDGRTGDRVYGEPVPERFGLTCIEIDAGRSTQATLLGRDHKTYESLYLSPAICSRSDLRRDNLYKQMELCL